MKFEHFGINVPRPQEMAAWYVRHFNMSIVRAMNNETFTHFLADVSGRVVMELYANNTVEIPDYSKQHPLRFHFAFEVDDPEKFSESIIDDGATFFEEQKTNDGSHLMMLRDPWGIPLQICRRGKPFN